MIGVFTAACLRPIHSIRLWSIRTVIDEHRLKVVECRLRMPTIQNTVRPIQEVKTKVGSRDAEEFEGPEWA